MTFEPRTQHRSALLRQHAADHLRPDVEPAVADDVPQRPDGARLLVVRTEHQTRDAGEHQRPGTHRARLERHRERAAGQPPLPHGAVIGRGWNAREAWGDPTAHAEVIALREAARAVGEWRLTGCTLVVSLEPCTMCAGALVLARVSRLVFGAYDPKAGAVGSLWDVVRDRRLNVRPEVVGGVLADECGQLLRTWFETHREVR